MKKSQIIEEKIKDKLKYLYGVRDGINISKNSNINTREKKINNEIGYFLRKLNKFNNKEKLANNQINKIQPSLVLPNISLKKINKEQRMLTKMQNHKQLCEQAITELQQHSEMFLDRLTHNMEINDNNKNKIQLFLLKTQYSETEKKINKYIEVIKALDKQINSFITQKNTNKIFQKSSNQVTNSHLLKKRHTFKSDKLNLNNKINKSKKPVKLMEYLEFKKNIAEKKIAKENNINESDLASINTLTPIKYNHSVDKKKDEHIDQDLSGILSKLVNAIK